MRGVVSYLVWLVFDGGWFQWLSLLLVTSSVFILAVTQGVISLFYFFCPFPSVLDKVFKKSASLQTWFSFHLQGPNSEDFGSMVVEAGYQVEEHITETEDGFRLCLFRIVKPQQQQQQQQHPQGDGGQHRKQRQRAVKEQGPAVLCMHGLMMCSDVWIVMGKSSLPFALCDSGYDVWLGNNRGNRYSCKHKTLSPSQEEFWNWSLDELARYDVPAMISKIQQVTARNEVAYLGFSQGTAQGFAALTLHPQLEAQVPLVVALSPAVAVCGLSSAVASAIIQASPTFIYLLFGHRAMLASAPAWQTILSPQAFVRIIDMCLRLLFGWNTREISPASKGHLYRHLYSPSSVKSVVHWFQIITRNSGGLSVYDDTHTLRSDHKRNFRVTKYDISRLRVPCAIFYGRADTIIDEPKLEKMLGDSLVFTHVEDTYEHLDFLWAASFPSRGQPKVLEVFRQYHPIAVKPSSTNHTHSQDNTNSV